MEPRIDLAADLNDEDDKGLGWSTLGEARDPGKITGLTKVFGIYQSVDQAIAARK